MASSGEQRQRRRTVNRRGDSENGANRRSAWRAVAIEVGVGLLLWAACLYMMNRLNWNFTAMVGGGALRTSGPAIPAWGACALLGSIGLAAVVSGAIDTRRIFLHAQATHGLK